MANGILLTYSFDSSDILHKVPNELIDLKNLCKNTPCFVEIEERVSQQSLEKRFQLLKDNVLIFHFAGHAKGSFLQMNLENTEDMTYIDMFYFTEIIAKNCKGLKLVFLNGCSSHTQAQYLLDNGIPAVISTTLPLNDAFAYQFARAFYERFFNRDMGYTLQEAFGQTLASFNADTRRRLISEDRQLNTSLLYPEIVYRGLDVHLEDDLPIYSLQGREEALAERFVDWHDQEEPEKLLIELDSTVDPPLYLHPESYLLCNREEEEEGFIGHLELKMKASAEPSFIFLTSNNQHCPYDLVKRFEKFTLRRDDNLHFLISKLRFPDPAIFDLPADPNKPMQRLKEYYDELSKGFAADGNKSKERFAKDQFVVAVHLLPSRPWKDGISALFDYYLGAFSRDLQNNLCERLIVICLLEYDGKDAEKKDVAEKYKQMFGDLKRKHPNRVLFFDELTIIQNYHLENWHFDVFDEMLDGELYSIDNEMFFKQAKQIMELIIKDQHVKKAQ